MLSISVELLHGTFRGDPDGVAATGGATRGEWPPSPSRLFAAFVAADGTGDRCRFTDGAELAWLEGLPAPAIRAAAARWEQQLHPRYVVEQTRSAVRNTHQEYVGRKATLARPGHRVSPRRPLVTYSWDVEAPSESKLKALRVRAARIGYLGTSDSPVRVRVATRLPAAASEADLFTPDPDGTLMINAPGRGDVEILDRMYAAWVTQGPAVARSQYPALRHETPYRPPWVAAPEDRGGVIAWLRLGTAVSGRRIGAVTALFKEAVLSKYQELHGEPPALLHGHGFKASGYDLARFSGTAPMSVTSGRGDGFTVWRSGCPRDPIRLSARGRGMPRSPCGASRAAPLMWPLLHTMKRGGPSRRTRPAGPELRGPGPPRSRRFTSGAALSTSPRWSAGARMPDFLLRRTSGPSARRSSPVPWIWRRWK